MVIPFALLLLAIALVPLLFPRFAEKNRNKGLVVLVLSLPVLAVFLKEGQGHFIAHSLHEYVSFLALLGSLFVISGGIVLRGDLTPKPSTNTLILLTGAILANLIGTTGASMLLIRPYLRTNAQRRITFHLPIFFIFVVSNVGGLLTPLGDPPLFLGYLRGVPFIWTLKLFPVWAFMVAMLLAIFFFWDRYAYRKESLTPSGVGKGHQVEVAGGINFLFLGGILAAVFLPSPYREGLMVVLTAASLLATPQDLRKENGFTFHPIIEVALLFAGIFITMVPALLLLEEHGREFGLTQAWHFFWTTGALSSVLDNAPTYLTFFSVAQGLGASGDLIAGVPEHLLRAISCGAVLMGANTYIGNGPNFMVKAIADEANFKTPKFLGYMIYAVTILGPLYLLCTWVFFL